MNDGHTTPEMETQSAIQHYCLRKKNHAFKKRKETLPLKNLNQRELRDPCVYQPRGSGKATKPI
jgi:hypothetical protein